MRTLVSTQRFLLCACVGAGLLPAQAAPKWMDELAELSKEWLAGSSSCDKRPYKAATAFFETSLETHLPGEEGLSRLSNDLRTGTISLPDSPHVYAIMGGGKWGPRLAAKVFLESVFLEPWGHAVVVDLEVAARLHNEQGLDEAQQWVKGKVASAIRTCPGGAAVVFDNAHSLAEEDVLLLDPLLLLFDDNRSHMVDGNSKVSGEGSLFLLLLNEEASDGFNGLDGKARLHLAWEYDGPAFTTKAFVGRVDAAMLLSSPPPVFSSDKLSALKDLWREAVATSDPKRSSGSWGGTVPAIRGVDPRALHAIGATAAGLFVVGAMACLARGLVPVPDESSREGDTADVIIAQEDANVGGGSGGDSRGGSAKNRPLEIRGGGSAAPGDEHSRLLPLHVSLNDAFDRMKPSNEVDHAVVYVGASDEAEARGGRSMRTRSSTRRKSAAQTGTASAARRKSRTSNGGKAASSGGRGSKDET